MKQYGEYLKELREARKLSIEQVSEDTKIVTEVIEALESMNKEKIASEVHLIGFIKLYTKYLGGDEKVALELFRSTAVSEIPIQFDVINISKKKRAKRTYSPKIFIIPTIVILILACILVLWMNYPKIYSFFVQKKSSKLPQSTNITTIESVYENTFLLKEAILLVKGGTKATAVITSISPPTISVEKKKYTLEENVPTSIFLTKDITYVVILRNVDVIKRSLLLRFDPRSTNPRIPQTQDSEISTSQENTLQHAINNADGEVFTILSSSLPSSIQVQLATNIPESVYYQYETAEEKRQGILSAPISKTITAKEYIDIYVSNTAVVQLRVNEVTTPLSRKNLPMVFRIQWKQESANVHTLLLIPLP